MTDFVEAEVRQNPANDQKLLTVPKESDIKPGEKVRLIGLGHNWDDIPNHLKIHHNLRKIIDLLVNADKTLEPRNGDEDIAGIVGILEEAGDTVSEAIRLIEDERPVYAEIQDVDSCNHPNVEKNDGQWHCTRCLKLFEPA